MTSLRLLLVFFSLFVVDVHCSCNADGRAKGAACWKDDWKKRDAHCGSEIDNSNDRRFSFEHAGSRCFCCPPKQGERRSECAVNCNACEAAGNAAGCWANYQIRDESCGSEIDSDDDRRFSFERASGGDRCYCCPTRTAHHMPSHTPRGHSAKAQILSDHNQYRARHGSPALKFDDTLNRNAQAHADKLAWNDAGLSHSSNNENLFSANGIPATSATRAWYSEESNYDYNYGGHSSSTGHFTALVWRSSTHLGVGIAQASSGNTYVVAQYWPVGNVAGHFRANVLPPQ